MDGEKNLGNSVGGLGDAILESGGRKHRKEAKTSRINAVDLFTAIDSGWEKIRR
jgi:hypothetical protein